MKESPADRTQRHTHILSEARSCGNLTIVTNPIPDELLERGKKLSIRRGLRSERKVPPIAQRGKLGRHLRRVAERSGARTGKIQEFPSFFPPKKRHYAESCTREKKIDFLGRSRKGERTPLAGESSEW